MAKVVLKRMGGWDPEANKLLKKEKQKSEYEIRKPVVEFARGRGIEVIKLSTARGGMGTSGWPDWMFLVRGGRPIFMEFKRPGEQPEKIQLERLNYLRLKGYDAYVVEDSDYGINLLMVKL